MRHNNFDALRLIAALMVVHGHGADLTGQTIGGLWNLPFHRVGLDIFFAISGYLVTGSWERTPARADFLLKRCLRIFPGLIACVAVTVFVLGVWATTLPLGRYLAAGGLLYFTNVALFLQLKLPGVFTDSAAGAAVNGSLWSLGPEFICYFTIPALAVLRTRFRLAALLVLAFGAGTVSIAVFAGRLPMLPLIWHIDPKYALAEVPFFAVGSLLCLVERHLARTGRVEAMWRADLCLLFMILNFGVSAWFGWGNLPVEWLTLPYMVIGFGRMALPGLSRAGRFGDASYGTYLYAWPIQKLVLELLPRDPLPVLTCAALSLCAGLLSWHLVERPIQAWGLRAVRRRRSRPVWRSRRPGALPLDPAKGSRP